MTDAQGSRPSTSRTAESREGSSKLKDGLKWFGAEFLVVVAGILVALGLQAWWQDRQDASRGAEYERQLLSDVRETQRSLRESIVIDRAHSQVTNVLTRALYAPGTPTRGQALGWLQSYSGWTADPRPVLGNVNALIQTGEIRLVSNPTLRRAIISYASVMETTWEDRRAQTERMIRANDLSLARLEAADVPPFLVPPSEAGTYAAEDLQDYLPAYMAAWSRLRADGQFRTAQQWRLFAYSNIEFYNREMLSATTRLRKDLEANAP